MATQLDAKAKAIMLFSRISNINYDYSASLKNLDANSDRIPGIISSDNVASQKINALWDCGWHVVWGPALYHSKLTLTGKHHANNSMYVVKGVDQATNKHVYVVAVAGTNSLSSFEKFEEDIATKKVEPWNAAHPEHGYIAKGSMVGLNKVLGKFDYGADNTIMEFFEAEVQHNGKENMEIITCGHSLGGALSPLVALKLKEAYPDVQVSAYPTAGPTSGDAVFAQYMENTLGADNYISVINTEDIVPMAWEYDTLTKIATVYDNAKYHNIKPTLLVAGLLKDYEKATKDLNYTRIGKATEQTFPGMPKPAHSNDTTPIHFMEEALYQHLDTYSLEFFPNEGDFIEAFEKLLKTRPA